MKNLWFFLKDWEEGHRMRTKSWHAMRKTEEHKDSKLEKAQMQESQDNEGTNWGHLGLNSQRPLRNRGWPLSHPSDLWGLSLLFSIFHLPKAPCLQGCDLPCVSRLYLLSQPSPRALKRPGKNRLCRCQGLIWDWPTCAAASDHSCGKGTCYIQPACGYVCVRIIHIISSLPLCCLMC